MRAKKADNPVDVLRDVLRRTTCEASRAHRSLLRACGGLFCAQGAHDVLTEAAVPLVLPGLFRIDVHGELREREGEKSGDEILNGDGERGHGRVPFGVDENPPLSACTEGAERSDAAETSRARKSGSNTDAFCIPSGS